MKKLKYIIIAFIVIGVLSFIQLGISYHNYEDIPESVLVYNGQDYEQLSGWTMLTNDFTEVSAFVGKAEDEKKEPNQTVRILSGTDDKFIEADIHETKILFHKKGDELPSYLNPDNIESLEAFVDGKYVKLSSKMQEKFFQYLEKHLENSKIFGNGHTMVSNLRVTYKDYYPALHYIGSITEIENGNLSFLPCESLDSLGYGVYLPLPFNPLSEIEEGVK